MPVELKAEGLEGMEQLLKVISKIGQVGVSGVEFHGTQRKDGSGDNNAQVIQWLKDGGRDYVTPDNRTLVEIAEIFAARAQDDLSQTDAFLSTFKGVHKDPDRLATQIAAKAFIEAMDFWRLQILEMLNTNRTVDGTAKPVTEEYAAQRQKDYGVSPDVVGRATGDLLANFADKKAIKLKKS